MLTPGEVEQKTFSTALRGYDLDEVDDFLDEIVTTLKQLNEQLEAAKASRAQAPSSREAASRGPAVDESAVGRALIAAQTAADKLLQDAQADAERIVAEARSAADTFEADKQAKLAEVEAEMASLTGRISSARLELTVLAGEVADKLDQMEAVLGGGSSEKTRNEGGDLVELAKHLSGEANAKPASEDGGAADGEESTDSEGSEGGDDETSGQDHLDEILSGVATDLQLSADEEDSEDRE